MRTSGERKRLRREGGTCADAGYVQRDGRDVCNYWQRGNVRNTPAEAVSLNYVRDRSY